MDTGPQLVIYALGVVSAIAGVLGLADLGFFGRRVGYYLGHGIRFCRFNADLDRLVSTMFMTVTEADFGTRLYVRYTDCGPIIHVDDLGLYVYASRHHTTLTGTVSRQIVRFSLDPPWAIYKPVDGITNFKGRVSYKTARLILETLDRMEREDERRADTRSP